MDKVWSQADAVLSVDYALWFVRNRFLGLYKMCGVVSGDFKLLLP